MKTTIRFVPSFLDHEQAQCEQVYDGRFQYRTITELAGFFTATMNSKSRKTYMSFTIPQLVGKDRKIIIPN
jgi:hypothetical protein